MHSFPWWADAFFTVTALVLSWKFWAVVVLVAAIWAYIAKK